MMEAYKEGLKELEAGDVIYAAKKFNEAEILFDCNNVMSCMYLSVNAEMVCGCHVTGYKGIDMSDYALVGIDTMVSIVNGRQDESIVLFCYLNSLNILKK